MVLGIACSLTCKESSYFWGRGKAGSSISQLPPPREGVRKLDISQDFSPTLLNLGGGCAGRGEQWRKELTREINTWFDTRVQVWKRWFIFGAW